MARLCAHPFLLLRVRGWPTGRRPYAVARSLHQDKRVVSLAGQQCSLKFLDISARYTFKHSCTLHITVTELRNHPFLAMRTACIYTYLLFLLFPPLNATALPTAHAPSNGEETVSIEHPSATWSNEAIFTLIGVCVTVVGILIGLLSSPKLRQWLCKPFRCKQDTHPAYLSAMTPVCQQNLTWNERLFKD
jgi:hypothetical protein